MSVHGDPTAQELTIERLAPRLRDRQLSPVELLRVVLARIARFDGGLHAYLQVCHESALQQARVAEAEIASGRYRGPLHGIPYALKDLIDVRGLATTAHSRVPDGTQAPRHAEIVERLEASGAVLVGKVALDEFACGGATEDGPWPAPINPWSPAALTGGSSSGSGVAVAAGLAVFSIGTDTAGSIRHPASRCGIAGLKPTLGLVSRNGVFPLAPSLDCVGPMARTAHDCALVLDAIAERRGSPWQQRQGALAAMSLADVRIGVLESPWHDDPDADPEQVDAIEAAIALLAQRGARVVRLPRLPLPFDANAICRLLLGAEGFTVHERWLAQMPERYGRRTRQRLLQGAFFTADDYQRAQQCRRLAADRLQSIWQDVDVVLTASGLDKPVDRHAPEALPNAYRQQARMLFNLTGNPALVLPSGVSPVSGQPLSLQLVGRYFDEATLFRVACVFEQERAAFPTPAAYT